MLDERTSTQQDRPAMQVSQLPLPGLALIELRVHQDNRGFFVERFQADQFETHGLPTRFIQDNHSRSLPHVLRGLHYQVRPSQGKLVGAIRGRIWDVAADIRTTSATFGQSYGVELSDTNGRLLWIPAGFAHGFCVLGDEPADVLYKVDARYNASGDCGLRWDDPDLAISWPVRDPILSAKDAQLESFDAFRRRQAECECSVTN